MLYTVNLPQFGEVRFSFLQDGGLQIYSDINKDVVFIAVIKSLDSNLSAAVCYHESFKNYDLWTYSFKIDLLKHQDHPGFELEIYDQYFNTLLHKKRFVKNSRSIYPVLSSNHKEVTYSPYYDFFYNDWFSKNCELKDTDVVYDLGANIGIFSLYCSNFGVDSVYSFEPHPECFKHLKSNCDRYGKNITCFEKAIFNDFKKVSFKSPDFYSMGSGIATDGNYTVDAINLETFVRVNALKNPTVIKIDIEGGEFDFFNSTSDGFFESVNTVIFDFHGQHDQVVKIKTRFESLGYKVTGNVSDDSYLGVLLFKK